MERLYKLLWVTAAVLLVGFLTLSPYAAIKARAEPIATAAAGKVSVTLYTEPCALKAVTNLPQRAVWIENGKTIEGCWGGSQVGVVMTYWADLTVAVVPIEVFVKAGPAI